MENSHLRILNESEIEKTRAVLVVVEDSYFPTPFPKGSQTNPEQAEFHHLKHFQYKIIVSYACLTYGGPK
jgi:hypothetical protein